MEKKQKLKKILEDLSTPAERFLDAIDNGEGLPEVDIKKAYEAISTPEERLEDFLENLDKVKGKDGKTPDKDELLELIKPLIPKVKDGKDGKNGKDGIGINGKDGKDGNEFNAKDIIEKMGAIKDGTGFSVLKLKDLEWLRTSWEKGMNWSSAGFKVYTDATLTGDGSFANPLHSISTPGLTKTQADTYYYPLSSNPAGYLTSSTAPGAFYWTSTAGFLNPTTLGDQILWNFDGDQQYMGNTDASKFHIGGYATASGTLAGLINTAHTTANDFSHYYLSHNVPTPTNGIFTTTDDSSSTSYIVSFSDIGWLDIFKAPAKGGAGAPVFSAIPTFSLDMITGNIVDPGYAKFGASTANAQLGAGGSSGAGYFIGPAGVNVTLASSIYGIYTNGYTYLADIRANQLKFLDTDTGGISNVFVGVAPANNTGSYNSFFGNQAGISNTSGGNNTFLGYYAGISNTSGSNNTFLGYYSGTNNLKGINNTFIGYYAGYQNTNAGSNTAVGMYALQNQTYTNNGTSYDTYNTAIGMGSLYNLNPTVNTNGFHNTALGYNSGYGVSSGTYNTYLGEVSGYNSSSGSYNVAVGYQAGYGTGSSNPTYTTFIGSLSGYKNAVDSNTAVGYASLYNNTYARYNTAVGVQALNNQTYNSNSQPYDSNNTAVGYQALYNTNPSNINNGKDNTAVGYKAGNSQFFSIGNTYIGSQAGLTCGSGQYNTAVGAFSQFYQPTGSYNTTLGYYAGYGASSATFNNNTFIGYQSGKANNAADDNTAVGYNTLYQNIWARKNVAIGSGALQAMAYSNGSGYDVGNTAIGYQAFYNLNSASTSTGYHSTAVGSQAGYTQGSATGETTFVGYQAGYNNTGSYNTSLGSGTLYNQTTGSYNTAVGYNAGYGTSATPTNYGTHMGYQSGKAIKVDGQTAVGYNTLYQNIYGQGMVAIGYAALQAFAYNSGSGYIAGNTAVGYYSMYNINSASANTNGIRNTALGYQTMYSGTTVTDVTMIGFDAGYFNSGNNNTAVGSFAFYNQTSGTNNTTLGYYAGYGTLSAAWSDCTFIGYQSGKVNGVGVNGNTAVGSNTLYQNIYGSGQTAIGCQSLQAFSYNSSIAFIAANTAVGYQALYNTNPSGSTSNGIYNTGVGYQAGYSASSATANTSMGYLSGYYNTSSGQTSIGYQALRYQTAGTYNTAVGYNAGSGSTNASFSGVTFMGYGAGAVNNSNVNDNTGVGYNVLYQNPFGKENTAVGSQALQGMVYNSGSVYVSGNTAIGFKALYSTNPASITSSGSSNTAVGHQAGYLNITGYNNVFIGKDAGYSSSSDSYSVKIGYQAGYTSGSSNSVMIGSFAGYKQNTAGLFYLDNPISVRADIASEQAGALMWGAFNSTNTSQTLRFNIGTLTLLDGAKIVSSATTTGLKIGASGDKLGFFNATPVVKPAAATDLGVALSDLGLRIAGTAYPITTSGSVTLGSLTSGRIPITGTSGLLGDSTSLTWDTTYGLKSKTIYGEMYGDNVSINVTVSSLNVYYQVPTGLSGGTNNGFTFSASGLTCLVAGKYKVDWSITGQVPNNDDYIEGAVMINTTAQSNTANATTVYRAVTPSAIGGTGIITLAANDVVYLCLESTTSTGTYIVTHANLTLIRIDN